MTLNPGKRARAAGKIRELVEEFRSVTTGRGNLLDTLLPPIVFLLLNATLGSRVAILGSLAAAVALTGMRIARRQRIAYALGGLGGAGLAILAASLSGSAEGYFLPGIFSAGLAVILTFASLLARRPLVAWTSHLARRWPLDWYWHPRVRPAYTEVSWLWLLFFTLRFLLQIALFRERAAGLLGAATLLTGWPATIALLAVSYLYGTWRLRDLGGPSVEELSAGTPPPWEGQQRGF